MPDGPLRVHATNPRYFADRSGRPVYLTGSHTWAVVQDGGTNDPPVPLDWPAFLNKVREHGHNFIRLWTWEHPSWASWWKGEFHFTPTPWRRTGPGTALDGGLRFDLSQINDEWLKRLRHRVRTAGEAGIYVSVMLFQGWSAGLKPEPWVGFDNPWRSHPFHASNNVNGVDGSGGNEEGADAVHTLANAEVTRFQEQLVSSVIDAVNEFPHVMYEIANECDGSAENTEWQYHMIKFIHAYEWAEKPFRHPVMMTSQWPDPRNDDLFRGPAEAVAPFSWRGIGDERWEYEAPAKNLGKVVFLDTDHLWGVGGTVDWVWRSFMRGYNPLYMDPWGFEDMDPLAPPGSEDVRQAMGQTRRLAEELDLATMLPTPEVSSTGFALYDGVATAVLYQPYEDRLCVDLGRDLSQASVLWWHPVEPGRTEPGSLRIRGRSALLVPPWPGRGVAVIRLGTERRGETER